MKAIVCVVDDEGNMFEGNVELQKSPLPDGGAVGPIPSQGNSGLGIDFALPIRMFVKKHGAIASSGAARFTILIAFLTGGSLALDVANEDVENRWRKLTGHLGSFNRAHSTRAKDRGWVDSIKTGTYRLGPLWREAFHER